MPDKLVRVKIGGFEKNVGEPFAKNKGLDVLKDEATLNRDGTPRATTRTGGRRVKKRTTVKKAAATKKAAAQKSAGTAEEASK